MGTPLWPRGVLNCWLNQAATFTCAAGHSPLLAGLHARVGIYNHGDSANHSARPDGRCKVSLDGTGTQSVQRSCVH